MPQPHAATPHAAMRTRSHAHPQPRHARPRHGPFQPPAISATGHISHRPYQPQAAARCRLTRRRTMCPRGSAPQVLRTPILLGASLSNSLRPNVALWRKEAPSLDLRSELLVHNSRFLQCSYARRTQPRCARPRRHACAAMCAHASRGCVCGSGTSSAPPCPASAFLPAPSW